jgi:molecular chaperone DnaK
VTPPVIGIDLGTTNSVVSYTDGNGMTTVIADENGDRIVPSVIHFTQDGEYVVGRHAKEYAKVEPERVARVFKRGMGARTFQKNHVPFLVDGKEWSPEELSSLVLKKLAQMAAQHFGEPAIRAVITVPYYFGEPERAATRSAGELAGLEVLQIVNEPTAAAVAHGIDAIREDGELVVFDLGGGTFDVTIMRFHAEGEMKVIAASGDRELGGVDFDDAILERMIEQVRNERGIDLTSDPWMLVDATARAEEIKKELSTSKSSTRALSVGGKPIEYTLTREQFDELIKEQAELVEDAVLNAIEKADLEPSAITHVLMVGGSSRIPMFQEMVARLTGATPELTKNLDEDVSRGAAMLGAKLGGSLDPRSELAKLPSPIDAASHALGLTLVDEEGSQYNEVIIPEATPVPYKDERVFAAASDHQVEIEVILNEGSDKDLDFVRQLSMSRGRFDAPVEKGHPLRCEIEYTAEQLVTVKMFDAVSSQFLCDVEVKHEGMLSAEEKSVARDLLARAEIR